LLVERMLADPGYSHWWGTHFQYNAFIVTILIFAAVDGAVRLDRWATRAWRYLESRKERPGQTMVAEIVGASPVAAGGGSAAPAAGGGADRPAPAQASPGSSAERAPVRRIGTGVIGLACCAAICLAGLYTVPQFALGRMLRASFYEMTPREKAIAAADARVPSGVVVAAANFVGSELSDRDTVLMWDGDGYASPFAAPWVVADIRRNELGFSTLADQRADVALLQRHGYWVVFRSYGIIVLHRAGPPHLGLLARPLDLSSKSAG